MELMLQFGTDLEKVKNSDLVVYTAAISQDNAELVEAKRLNIKTCERAVFLGKLTEAFKETIRSFWNSWKNNYNLFNCSLFYKSWS